MSEDNHTLTLNPKVLALYEILVGWGVAKKDRWTVVGNMFDCLPEKVRLQK